MKFLHLGDLHLGKRVHGFSMLNDQKFALKQIVRMAVANRVDAVVIAGDIYDKTIPSGEAVGLFDSFFTKLCQAGICVLAVSGNHDSGERLNFGTKLLEQSGFTLVGTFDGTVKTVSMQDEYGEVQFHLLPWIRPMEWKERLHLSECTQQCAMEQVMQTIPQTDARQVLVAHTFVTAGGMLPEQSDSEIVPVGGLDAVDAALFERFDYTALGHLHRPQKIGRLNIRYAGSLLKYSFSEARYPKSVPLVELTDTLHVELLPLTPLHEMRELRGRLEDVISPLVVQAGDCADYIRVTLTNDEELFDAQSTLKAVYPNLMQLDFDNTRTRTADSIGLSDETAVQKLSVEQLFAQFFEEQNGKPMTEWQTEAIASLCSRLEEEE